MAGMGLTTLGKLTELVYDADPIDSLIIPQKEPPDGGLF
jgi:hypothetical protein